MQIVNNSSNVYEINFQMRDLLTGFEEQNNKLSACHGQGQGIAEERIWPMKQAETT